MNKAQQCPGDFFHVLIVHLQRMWRKQVQSGITSPLCVGDEHWTAKVTEKEPIVSHGTCHNFPCYFSAAQGIAVVLVGLVLLYILFCGLKNLFFSLALWLHICSCMNSVYKDILISILFQQGCHLRWHLHFWSTWFCSQSLLVVTLIFQGGSLMVLVKLLSLASWETNGRYRLHDQVDIGYCFWCYLVLVCFLLHYLVSCYMVCYSVYYYCY